MLSASEKAETKLKEELLHRLYNVGLGFRVTEYASDSKGKVFSIKLDHRHVEDHIVELDGVYIFIDPASAVGLEDYELDYLEETAAFCLRLA